METQTRPIQLQRSAKRRLAFYIDRDLAKALKIICVEEERPISRTIEGLVSNFVAGRLENETE